MPHKESKMTGYAELHMEQAISFLTVQLLAWIKLGYSLFYSHI